MTPSDKRYARLIAGTVALTCLVAWSGLCATLWAIQDRMIYPGAGGPERAASAGWERVAMPTADGTLVGYHHAGAGPETILFLHGNGTDFEGARAATAAYVQAGWGVMIPEYPGYGGNPGRPRQRGLDAAALAGLQWLGRNGTSPDRVVVMGNSLGAGPAIRVASHGTAGLVVISGLADMDDILKGRMPWVPRILLHDHYRNVEDMHRVRGPVMVVHARDDDVVPFGQGEMLARASGTKLIATASGGHAIAYDGHVQHVIGKTMDRWVGRGTSEGEKDEDLTRH